LIVLLNLSFAKEKFLKTILDLNIRMRNRKGTRTSELFHLSRTNKAPGESSQQCMPQHSAMRASTNK